MSVEGMLPKESKCNWGGHPLTGEEPAAEGRLAGNNGTHQGGDAISENEKD